MDIQKRITLVQLKFNINMFLNIHPYIFFYLLVYNINMYHYKYYQFLIKFQHLDMTTIQDIFKRTYFIINKYIIIIIHFINNQYMYLCFYNINIYYFLKYNIIHIILSLHIIFLIIQYQGISLDILLYK